MKHVRHGSDRDITQIKRAVTCDRVLDANGWKLDQAESTRKHRKYRRGDGEVLIVTHEGQGWWDPTSRDKGSVFHLICRVQAVGMPKALALAARLAGQPYHPPADYRHDREEKPVIPLDQQWAGGKEILRDRAARDYLTTVRKIPLSILRAAAEAGDIKSGIYGTAWFRHADEKGRCAGWEMRGPPSARIPSGYRGFSTGGAKRYFRFHPSPARHVRRVAVCEAAIDALSLAAMEENAGTMYLSCGGQVSPDAEQDLVSLLHQHPGCILVAATDDNGAGERFADRLKALADQQNVEFQRLSPAPFIDWNDVLRAKSAISP